VTRVWRGAILAVVVAAGSLALRPGPAAQTGPTRRVVLLSFDGVADWMVDHFIERGKAPLFERIAREGARAEAMLSVLPTLTAPSHATLWTGVSPRTHLVTGNTVLRLPRPDHSLMDRTSGFDQWPAVEPIWSYAARHGRRSLILQAAATRPAASLQDYATQFDIYSRCTTSRFIEGRLPDNPDEPYRFDVDTLPVNLRRSPGDSVVVEVAGHQSILAPRRGSRFSPPIAMGDGLRMFRLGLLSYEPASGAFTAIRGRVCELLTNRPDKLAAFRRHAGTIVGESVVDDYLTGRYGLPLANGGAGDAEDVLSDILDANHEFFEGSLRFAAEEPWDLLVGYVSTLDAMGHALAGVLDPSTMGYRADVAERVWPWVERMFARAIEGHTKAVRDLFPDAAIVIVSDHGMEGSSRTVHPNVALREAGLLALDAHGQLSLSGTLALHVYGNGGGIFINTADRKGGIVPLEERARVKRRVTAALLAVRDPLTGIAPIRAVIDTDIDGLALGLGGDASAELYIDLAPGSDLSAEFDRKDIVTAQDGSGSGDHGGGFWHRGLQAIFFAHGPGIAAGARPGLVRAIDVAPTVARLLGIPPPAHAEGRALDLTYAPSAGGAPAERPASVERLP
jgi:predicted AlkP superfamily phosphohydrolase/phosphomutase